MNDGYLRMTPAAFYALEFHQHMCLQDPDLLHDLWREGIHAVSAGYYELVCADTQPVVSVGCAWHVTAGCLEVKVGMDDVSSNVMLLDANGNDYGAHSSHTIIQNWLCSDVRQREFMSAVIKETSVRHHI